MHNCLYAIRCVEDDGGMIRPLSAHVPGVLVGQTSEGGLLLLRPCILVQLVLLENVYIQLCIRRYGIGDPKALQWAQTTKYCTPPNHVYVPVSPMVYVRLSHDLAGYPPHPLIDSSGI